LSSSSTCQDCIDLLLDYVDGELPAEQKAKLDDHFHGCQPCEDFLATYQATRTMCRKALAKTMPESVAEKLHTFLREEIGKGCK
jgi:anti-sigma factor RsiW